MNVGDEHSKSIWMDIDVAPGAALLDEDLSVDVLIVGSGIAGLSTAYELAKSGLKVAVVDRGEIGYGMTARTSAHLTTFCDDSTQEMLRVLSREDAANFHLSQKLAVDHIEEIQTRESIQCDFRRVPGLLFPGPDAGSFLDDEFDASRAIGVPVLKRAGLPFAGGAETEYLEFIEQAAFHPLLYLRGLAAVIDQSGGRIFRNSAVNIVEERGDNVVATFERGPSVEARFCVLATNSPIKAPVSFFTKQAPYRTYVAAYEIPTGRIPDALYWDTMDPYHYVRLHKPPGEMTERLLVGGCDHKTGEAADADIRFDALNAWIRALVPELGSETHRWSGQIQDTIDYAGFIGRFSANDRVFIATGDSGQGLTHGVAASLAIAGDITGQRPPWFSVYDPSRAPVSAAVQFVSENITAVSNLAERLMPGDINGPDDLASGQAGIYRNGLQKIAAYRDEKGNLHTRSAVCSHLGCQVHWNSFEKCWDCACHGSQFDMDGNVLSAPASAPLAAVE